MRIWKEWCMKGYVWGADATLYLSISWLMFMSNLERECTNPIMSSMASEREAGVPVVCSFGGMLVKRFVKFKSQLTFIRSPKSVMPLVSTQTSVGSGWKNSPPEGMESIDIRLSARQLLLGMLSLLIYTKCWSANNLPFSHKYWMTCYLFHE